MGCVVKNEGRDSRRVNFVSSGSMPSAYQMKKNLLTVNHLVQHYKFIDVLNIAGNIIDDMFFCVDGVA